ncbi:MAG: cytochrome c3 family protein [Kofleriaceae bacterium]
MNGLRTARVVVRRSARVTWLLALALILAGAGRALADDFFSSSPGPLSTSHATLDTQDKCNDCHVDGTRDTSNAKCLGCHDHSDLAARINAGKGFHSSPLIKGKKCETCHDEHKKRNFDIMGWKNVKGGESGFDHDLTGWPLNGKHSAIKCEECHKTRNKQGLRIYLGQDKLCGSCHKDDQPHGFERRDMMACERCHGESVWKPAKPESQRKFNHDDRKDAAMPLLGSHADVTCTKCHVKAKFNLPFADPDGCGNSGCHKSPHDNHIFGKAKDCEWCHSPTFKKLTDYRFDHDEKTKFDLGSAHRKMDCYTCHPKSLGEKKPSSSCETEACHAKDNKHGTRFKEFGDPPACGVCHPSVSWKPTAFNHDRRTNFKLTDKHATAACRSCHRGKKPDDFERLEGFRWPVPAKDAKCMGCHTHAKVHDKLHKDNECLKCHRNPGDTGGMDRDKLVAAYHGPKAKFPLVKAHRSVACDECHPGGKFKETPMECGARCHEDSLHKGSLGAECSRCHSPGTWDALRFDHDDDTEFKLKGEHKKNACESCHPSREFSGTPKECAAAGCHAADDVHRGRLGDKCEKCHLETGDNIFNHNRQAAFKVDGKHLDVRCADCHPSMTYKPRPTDCFGCHPEPDVHRGQYGVGCQNCHTTRSFEDVKPLHDVGDFSLKGSHDNIACNRCHRDNRPLAGAGNLCINCHRQDDIHSNSLSPKCGQCHTQWSFAPARFDHTRVGCNLTGLHRTLPCQDCHKSGNYGAVSPRCGDCHRDDAARRPTHVAGENGKNLNSCTGAGTCHNPNSWTPQAGSLRESVCR